MADRSRGDDVEEERGSAFSLSDVVSACRQRIKLIIATATIVTTVAAVIVSMLSNRYEAVASVQIDQRNKEITSIKGVISDLKADAATVDSEIEVIRSKQVSQRVIEQLGLRQDAEFVGLSGVQALLIRLGLSRGAFKLAEPREPTTIEDLIGGPREPERDEVARAFEQRLKVNRVRTSLVLEIHFVSADPVKAARIANAIAETYIKMQIEQKTRALVDASGRLEDAIRGVRDKVANAERAIEKFKSVNDIFDADGHLLVDRQLGREMEALVLVRNRTIAARSRYEQARRMMVDGEGNESLADVLQSNTVRLLRDELTKALRKQAEAATKYGPKHPEMQKISADVGKAQTELGGEITKIIRNLKTEFDVAADGEREQAARLDSLKEQISSSREKQWQLRELEREAAASKQLYEALLTRNKQTVETQGLQFADSRVVELSDVPLYPQSPKRKQLVAMAGVGGLVLGIGIALFLEMGTGSFARPRDIEQVLDVAHLGSVPGPADPHLLSADPLRTMRLLLAEPGGLFAEAIRGVRHELENRVGRAHRQVILVASSLPHEGRSVIASNLALQYAAGGTKTLLVDADLRAGGLSRDLGIADQPGLIDVLAGGVPAEQAILHDRATGVHVLSAARRPDFMIDAASLLESHHFSRILAGLKSQFDVIIVDAPPLLPVVDARIIAGHADAIVFVTVWRRTPRQLAKEALKCLGSDAAKVVGAIVNQVDHGTLEQEWGTIGRPYSNARASVAAGTRRAA
jgi:polysaccharide biosynthesis transport protein